MSNTILGFPPRFSSKLNQPDNPNTIVYLLNQLWSKVRISFEYNENNDDHFSVVYRSDDIILPPIHPEVTCLENLVIYLQELLEINGYDNYVVMLHGQDDKDFEILTYDDFLSKLEYPKEEYLAESHTWWGQSSNVGFQTNAIIHPKIGYPWVWVTPSTSGGFTSGGVDEFDRESICFKTSFLAEF